MALPRRRAVLDSGFKAGGLGISGFEAQVLGFRVHGLGFRAQGFGLRVCGYGKRSLGFRVLLTGLYATLSPKPLNADVGTLNPKSWESRHVSFYRGTYRPEPEKEQQLFNNLGPSLIGLQGSGFKV